MRGKELEESIAKKENCIKELESNLHEQNLINNRQQNEIKLLNERLTNEARRIKSLERENDRYGSEIALLEAKVCLLKCKFARMFSYFFTYVILYIFTCVSIFIGKCYEEG